MISEVIDQIVIQGVEYCKQEENVKKMEDAFLSPIIQHISRRFAWLTYSFQTMALLVILQTLLLVYLVFTVRKFTQQQQ